MTLTGGIVKMMMDKSDRTELLSEQADLAAAIAAWLCDLREDIDHTGC